MDEFNRNYGRVNLDGIPEDRELPRIARDVLMELVERVNGEDLRQAIKNEIKRMETDNLRLVTMLQQRSEMLEQENEDLRSASADHLRRYEKAVREMQFRKNNYDKAMELNRQYTAATTTERPRSLSIESGSSNDNPSQKMSSATHLQSYPLTPTSPQPSTLPMTETYIPLSFDPDYKQKASLPSRSSSTSTSSSSGNPFWAINGAGTTTDVAFSRGRQSSTTISNNQSCENAVTKCTSTDGSKSLRGRKQSWQFLQTCPSAPSTAPSATTSSPSLATNTAVHSVPMTPVRSSTATNGYTGASLIQQRRVDPLIFGGSDGLWETIAKSKGSDVTVEKIISNFLRRGGSPNTANKTPSANAVKYGYGMIHALIVTKAPGSLDLLLQQGANPNAMTLSQVEEDKVTPCYLAAAVGWLSGLQKLVQAGGDLMSARGAGSRNKTALHVAAEHCHAAVVEYIMGVTQGKLGLEVDSQGATVLHYACASGHTDLVSYLARSCKIPINQVDDNEELPLHWAARHGRLEVVTLLVDRCGCDFNAYVPRKVGTPLDLARAGGQKRLVDYLKSLGALSAKKMEKRREEEMAKEVPVHLESALAKNGFILASDDF
ncbi:Ankyrin repeat domain-containing protein 55 [Apophysomyces ossiformis]|uniref:Ankyrin repeat domain-containing protein 55 n=1 Tax=Apophysomyces ossiformis TaxID=679940 RepID=A0A8H7ELF7_9FUNG|nr:Ankyrin repeat domain-containing protein 55 [Apophysomyces ossiformis]